MDCTDSLSATPSSSSGAPSACVEQACIYPVLDCHNVPAWDLFDNQECNPESAYFKSVMCEFNDIAGFPIEIRVLLAQDDKLWGEDPNARLTEPIVTKAVYEPSEETSILNAWGLMGDDTMQYIVIPKTTYTRDMTETFTVTPELSAKPVRPMVGDIIRTIHNDINYEVVHTGDTQSVFMGSSYTWELIVRPFRFSEQSDEHRDVYIGQYDDPFETDTLDPTGGTVPQNNYDKEVYGDNDFVSDESDKIDDYRDISDPDKASFGF